MPSRRVRVIPCPITITGVGPVTSSGRYRVGLRPELPDALEVLGGLAVDAGRPAEGLRLLIAAGTLHRDMGQHCYHQAAVAADRERAAEALGSQAADITRQAGQLTGQAAISY